MRFIHKDPTIHPESFIAPGTQIVGDVIVEKNVNIWYNVVARGDVNYIKIGENTNIQDGTVIHCDSGGYPTIIGKNVTVGHRALLHGCVIEDECLIGMGAIILNGVTIGKGSFIGAGTLITEGKTIPPNSLVVGFPGKVIRQVTEEERKRMESSVSNYIYTSKNLYVKD